MTTLREQAAIAAMQGLLQGDFAGKAYRMCEFASVCVEYADALLAELARTTSPVGPEPAASTCTAAERELIEASIADPYGFSPRLDSAWAAAHEERRAASKAKEAGK